MRVKCVLSIAGSDSSGGAGIQADLKTMCALGVYGETALTALTAQNTMGVQGVLPVDPAFIEAQIDSVFEDICPHAVKIGMLPNAASIRAVACALRRHKAPAVVLDPVMVATSGDALSETDALETLITDLMPLATLVTPNLPEAAALAKAAGLDELVLVTRSSMEKMACAIASLGAQAVLVKGGHLATCADDVLLLPDGTVRWYAHERVDTRNTHGTGCTLSSAIASRLALGDVMAEAVDNAKHYLTGALEHDPHLGHGNGPVNHLWQASSVPQTA